LELTRYTVIPVDFRLNCPDLGLFYPFGKAVRRQAKTSDE
jgi:hypothetical protein